MAKEFNPKHDTGNKKDTPVREIKIDQEAIKKQYQEMGQQSQQQGPTDEQLAANRLQMETQIDSELPFMRKIKEHTELKICLARMDVELGNVNPNQVPGPLGKTLEIELMGQRIQWAQMKMEENRIMNEARLQQEELMRKQEQLKDKTRDVTVVFDKEYLGIPIGKEFIVTNAEDLKVQVPTLAALNSADLVTSLETEQRSLNIHRLEDEGIVHIVR